MENKDKYSAKFNDLISKATIFGKKAADGIQKGAKDISEQTQKTMFEQKMKFYNPLFKEKFFSEEFVLPEIIQIVEESDRKNVDVCEGAIGWTKKNNEIETLYIYKEFIEEAKIEFFPSVDSYAIYCVDKFNSQRYINIENIFGLALDEKIAELDRIAYSLGAKSFSIELVESKSDIQSSSENIMASVNGIGASIYNNNFSASEKFYGRKNITNFEGERKPVTPKLKWFSNDENIKNLIEMKCFGDYSIKSKTMILKGSSITSVSRKTAAAIDVMLKIQGNINIEKMVSKENSTQMIFEIEF